MNDQTKSNFAAILAAAQAKEAAKSQKPVPVSKPIQQPVKPVVKPVQQEVKTFDNLPDIEKAAKNGETISILNLYNLVNKKPEPVQEVKSVQPELSTLTSADLLSNTAVFCAPSSYSLPIPTKQQDTATVQPVKPKIQVIEYGKGLAVIGETKAIKHLLGRDGLNGIFQPRLSCGAGWIFPKSKLDAIKNLLDKL